MLPKLLSLFLLPLPAAFESSAADNSCAVGVRASAALLLVKLIVIRMIQHHVSEASEAGEGVRSRGSFCELFTTFTGSQLI